MPAATPVAVGGVDVSGLDLPGLVALPRLADGTVAGPLLAGLLARIDTTTLADDAVVLDVAAGWERLTGWVQAGGARVLADFGRRPDTGRGRPGPLGVLVREFGPEEAGLALGVSGAAAGKRLRVAADLASRLPATAAALGAGRLSWVQAAAVVEETAFLSDALARRVDEALLAAGCPAAARTPGRWRPAVRRAVLAADPGHGAVRERRARQGRRFSVLPLADGMAHVGADLPAAQALAIRAALRRAARAHRRSHQRDGRTVDQLRADLFAARLLAGPAAARDPEQAAVHVTVDWTVLAALTDQPAELAGYGPISAEQARAIAGQDATWRRLLTDPATGAVLDVGTTTYAPPAALARHVRARDQHCVFPGCPHPARAMHVTDLDHTIPFPAGPTADHNLGALCRHHHRLKQHPATVLTQLRPGHFTWTLPTGRRHTVQPPAVGPTDHSDPDDPLDDG